jgi:hypothetical protein
MKANIHRLIRILTRDGGNVPDINTEYIFEYIHTFFSFLHFHIFIDFNLVFQGSFVHFGVRSTVGRLPGNTDQQTGKYHPCRLGFSGNYSFDWISIFFFSFFFILLIITGLVTIITSSIG